MREKEKPVSLKKRKPEKRLKVHGGRRRRENHEECSQRKLGQKEWVAGKEKCGQLKTRHIEHQSRQDFKKRVPWKGWEEKYQKGIRKKGADNKRKVQPLIRKISLFRIGGQKEKIRRVYSGRRRNNGEHDLQQHHEHSFWKKNLRDKGERRNWGQCYRSSQRMTGVEVNKMKRERDTWEKKKHARRNSSGHRREGGAKDDER